MELIERYLQSVKLALPRSQQEDVVRELRDEVLSQVEDRENALGRPLTEDEQVALLKQMGHPMLLASRYRKQQYLVGPAIFPIYSMALKIVLGVVLFSMSISAVAVAVTGKGLGAALGVLAQFPMAAISVFAWVTFVAALIEYFYSQARFDCFGNWDPRKLPKLSKLQQKRRPTTLDTAAALFFGTAFGVWWLVGLKHQFFIFGPGVAYLHFGPVFQTIYPLFVAVVVTDIVRHTIALLLPARENWRFALLVFYRLLNLLVLYFLMNAPDLLVVGTAIDTNQQPLLKGLNQGLHICIVVAAVLTVAKLAWELYKFFYRGAENGRTATACL